MDEVWATNCQFFQQRIAETERAFAQLTYCIPSRFAVMFHRVCPTAPSRLDVIALFIQPMEEGCVPRQAGMYLVDAASAHHDLLAFAQVIFLQRLLVENQRPIVLPLEPRAKIPTQADSALIPHRR